MWFLWDLFDDTIDIVSAPVKFVARGTDKLFDSDWEFEDFTRDMANSLKTKQR